ncbi:uroporphyrinogen decarboxylase family protein [Candidatus Latescibacterota bacterium]
MTSRERVLTALNHEEPDSVPIHVDFTPEAAEKLSGHLQLDNSTAEAYSGKISELPLVMGHDLLVAWHGIATSYYLHEDKEEYTCEWGIGWRWIDFPGGRYTEMVRRPLADEQNLSSYSCPDPTESWRYDSARELIRTHGETHAIAGGMPCTLFEAAWYLRGYDRFLMDLMINRDFASELLDKLYDFQLVTGRKLAETGVDIIWMGDDFGMQNSLIVSPEIWRKFFKPRYAGLIQAFREIKPDVKIAYHSDGNIESLLPEYIEIGVDVLNAVQPKSMNTAHLKKRFGNKLSFWGTVDIQEVLPFGTVEDVVDEVKKRIQMAGQGGGLIIGPSHNIQPDVPLDNILAFYRAVEMYGKYPVV